MSILNLYLTSLEPNLTQSNCSQSIGGYISNSFLYLHTSLTHNVGLYDTTFSLDTPEGGWTSWNGVSYLDINGEMIRVSPITNGSITVLERGANDLIRMHLAGNDVCAISSKQLFNDVFNTDRKQYRCIAVQNDSEINTISDIGVFIKQNSRNDDSSIKIAIEKPASLYLKSNSTSRTTSTLIDTSLINAYVDNHFINAYLKPVGESIGGIVQSFDSSTGTFVFYNSFSTSTTNVEYEIFPAPAQRIKSGIVAPVTGGRVSGLITPSESSVLFLNDSTNSSVDSYLLTHDLFYIWIERTVLKGSAAMTANDFVLSIVYANTSTGTPISINVDVEPDVIPDTYVPVASSSTIPVSPSSGIPFSPFEFFQYSDEDANKLYDLYSPMLEGKTDLEKEEILIQLVINATITPDQAILIAVRAGLNINV